VGRALIYTALGYLEGCAVHTTIQFISYMILLIQSIYISIMISQRESFSVYLSSEQSVLHDRSLSTQLQEKEILVETPLNNFQ